MKNAKDPNLTYKDKKSVDVKTSNVPYPIIENINNAILWPEKLKGGIDLIDTYEVSSVPENPNTSLDSVETLKKKGVIPKQ
ncbi:MAG: hypothetical protein N2448_11365 [Caloramator sp.]|nr:hypothetical protein [Caloramator sp.]